MKSAANYKSYQATKPGVTKVTPLFILGDKQKGVNIMGISMFAVGDSVLYDGEIFTIEKDYGNEVYFIGNSDSWADLVNAESLDKVN